MIVQRRSKMSMRKALKELQDRLWARIHHEILSKYVDAEPEMIHPHTRHFIDTILECDDLMLAETMARKAYNKVEMQFLAMDSRKEVHKNTPAAFEMRAKAADYYAKLQYEKGNTEAGDKQTQRAADFRVEAQRLRAPPPEPVFAPPVEVVPVFRPAPEEPIPLTEVVEKSFIPISFIITKEVPKKGKKPKKEKEPKKGRRKK
jgi:hypothetical protein